MHAEFEFKSIVILLFFSGLYYALGNESIFLACFYGGAVGFFIISNLQVLLLIVLIALFNAFLASLVRLLYV
jgi:hypothetical protein